MSVGLDAWVLGRAQCTRRGAGLSISRRWLEFSESKNLTAESHELKNNWPEHHLRRRSLFRFCTNEIICATWPKSEARNRNRIRINLRICHVRTVSDFEFKGDADIGTKPPGRLNSFRYGDHTLGFHIKVRKTIALIYAQRRLFFVLLNQHKFAIKSKFGPKWHLLSYFLPDFGGLFSPSPTTYLIFSEGNIKHQTIIRYVIPSALAIITELDFLFGSLCCWLYFRWYLPKT